LPSAQRDNLPVAANASARVLCLPLYPLLSDDDIERVVSIIANPLSDARRGDA
jgi:dTDP-4-amino-4,6-dideoxygalactose transaminase